MYIPKPFKVEDKTALFEFVEKWSFGDLITTTQGAINISQVPFLIDQEQGVLYGHLAKQNGQLAELEVADDLTVIFKGPNAYISPTWYQSENMVPTWNFQSVQVRGKACLVGEKELLKIIDGLSQKREAQFDSPWTLDKVGESNLKAMMTVIVGFKISIDEIVGKFKLSQNRNKDDQLGVVTGLQCQSDEFSKLIADEMLQGA